MFKNWKWYNYVLAVAVILLLLVGVGACTAWGWPGWAKAPAAAPPSFDPSGCSEFSPKTGYALDPDVSRAAGECSWPEPSTPTPTVAPSETPTVTPTEEVAALVEKEDSEHLDAGKPLVVQIREGYIHFNLACAGCARGVEKNYLVKYDGPPVEVKCHEGSAWWYSSLLPEEDVWERALRGSEGDTWPETLPECLTGSGATLLMKPTAVTPTPTVAALPANPGKIIAQGEDKTVTLTAGKFYHLNVWWRGDPVEYNFVLRADQSGSFVMNGTVWEYQRLPSKANVWDANDQYPSDLSKLPTLKGKVTQYQLGDLPLA